MIELAKKAVKMITESALKREVERLERSLTQMSDYLKEIRSELKSTTKNTGQMIEMQKQLIASMKTMKAAAPRQVRKPRKLTEMNIFVRDQIRSGKSFAEAIKAWKEYKASKAVQEKAETKPVSGSGET